MKKILLKQLMKYSMLKIIWHTITNISITLRRIFICCLIFIFLYEYYLSSEINETDDVTLFHTINLLSKLSYSYISAFIFYILAVYLPKERKKLKLFLYLSNRITFIIIEINDIFKALDVLLNKQSPYSALKTWDDLENELKGVTPNTAFKFKETSYKSYNEFFELKWHRVKKNIDELLVFHDLLPNDVINSLVLIEGKFNNHYYDKSSNPKTFNSYALVLPDLYYDSHVLFKTTRKSITDPYAFRYHNSARKGYQSADEWRSKQKSTFH